MSIWTVALVVSACGALGGFVNAFLTGHLHLPRRTADVYSPGWMANVAIGAVVAFAVWSLYDASSAAAVIGAGGSNAKGMLTLAEVAASVALGIGAARLLATESKRRGRSPAVR
jgi:hypothetical protein